MRRNMTLAIIALLLALTAFEAGADTVKLSWNPPTTYTDNSELTDLGGYKVFWGTSSGNYTKNETVLTCVGCPDPIGTETEMACIPVAPGQTYHFAATAFNANGTESAYSEEVTMDIPAVSGILGNIDTTSPGSANRVDGYDLVYFSKCFGKGITGLACTDANFTAWKNSCENADLDYDGKVDGSDFGILSTNFGK